MAFSALIKTPLLVAAIATVEFWHQHLAPYVGSDHFSKS